MATGIFGRGTKVELIPLDRVFQNPHQPRKIFNAERLSELADSIRRHGVIVPIIVRRTDDGFDLCAGERRVRACRSLGMRTIPAIVTDLRAPEMLEVAFLENLQREGTVAAPERPARKGSRRIEQLVAAAEREAAAAVPAPVLEPPAEGPPQAHTPSGRLVARAEGLAGADPDHFERRRRRQVSEVEKLLQGLSEDGRLDYDRAEGLVQEVLQDLRGGMPAPALDLTYLRGPARYLPMHSLNVSRLALHVGIEHGHAAEDLADLGLAGLLHDVGMLGVPAWRYLQPRILSREDLRAVEAHAAEGATFLAGLPKLPPRVAAIAGQVHERHDGSGYPGGLAGEELDPLARILSICDAYEALSSPRVYRKPFAPASAMQIVLHEGSQGRFDPKALRAFVRALSYYPVGSVVHLRTGEMATVVAANPQDPRRPIVRLLSDAEGHALVQPKTVDLFREGGLEIAG